MTKPILIIGNKNYSSWSLRPYMALSMANISFEEKMIRFGEPRFTREVRKISKAGQVPILLHNGLMINDSLAIIEYLAEAFPAKNIWPKNKAARAMARSAAAEMHAGFKALRNACPMNLRRPRKTVSMSAGALADVRRIEEIWHECRTRFGRQGKFLFGKFGIADAMFAPVVTRLDTYGILVADGTRNYMDSVMNTAAFQSWHQAAMKETWTVSSDEVD